jgi:hypothetical protein
LTGGLDCRQQVKSLVDWARVNFMIHPRIQACVVKRFGGAAHPEMFVPAENGRFVWEKQCFIRRESEN